MTKPFADAIGKATLLTRSGRLKEATEVLQSALKGGAHANSTTNDAIEGTFTRPDHPEAKAMPDAKPMQREKSIAARLPLAESMRRLAAANKSKAGTLHKVAEGPLPVGAEFLSLAHKSRHGSRNYRLYVPSSRTELMPLVVMLHGCTQGPEDFAAGTGMNALAEEFGSVIAYPEIGRAHV